MQTIQMQLNKKLITAIDQIAKETNTDRSTFIHETLQKALQYYHQHKLIKKHREGYLRYPVKKDEFSVWENEQTWGK